MVMERYTSIGHGQGAAYPNWKGQGYSSSTGGRFILAGNE
jgi:hypothetical protein